MDNSFRAAVTAGDRPTQNMFTSTEELSHLSCYEKKEAVPSELTIEIKASQPALVLCSSVQLFICSSVHLFV